MRIPQSAFPNPQYAMLQYSNNMALALSMDKRTEHRQGFEGEY